MTREEAIEVYNGLINEKIKAAFEFFAPELRESEDERIRKALVWHLKAGEDFVSNGVTKAEYIAYLEKQKEQKPISQADFDAAKHEALWDEQKPTEWSEEDEKILNELLDHCNTENATWYDWLNSLRPPFKDREMKLKILKYLSTRCSSLEFEEVEDYLNNLRPSWKPSEEQMNCLCAAVDAAIRKHNESVSGYEPARVLKSLYEQLQRLM